MLGPWIEVMCLIVAADAARRRCEIDLLAYQCKGHPLLVCGKTLSKCQGLNNE